MQIAGRFCRESLALARQLVELMNGRIEVKSTVGVGTQVRVTLQTHGDANPTSPAPLTVVSGTTDDSEVRGTVLYIEDNSVNLILVEQLLMRWPDVVLLQAETGKDGLAVARSAKPDLILLDMRLPDMEGIQVLLGLQQHAATRNCPVVALSASAMPEDVTAARKAGARDYWTKPLDFNHFLKEVRSILSKR
jgi:CheY-like chemotaxis protein